MGEEHVAAATLLPETSMYPYMEAPAPAYPPIYDEPEATRQEVLDVVFGRSHRDGLGRDFDDLMSDTPMMLWTERISLNPDAERDLFSFLLARWGELPASVMAEIDELAQLAAKQ